MTDWFIQPMLPSSSAHVPEIMLSCQRVHRDIKIEQKAFEWTVTATLNDERPWKRAKDNVSQIEMIKIQFDLLTAHE